MSRKTIDDDGDRMTSVTFSLSQKQLKFITKCGIGRNVSEQLRNLLAESERFTGTIVRYNEQALEEGDFTPEFQSEGAVLVYYKSPDGYGFGDDLPFSPALPKFVNFQQMADVVTKQGYTTQIVRFPNHDFQALWAVKAIDRCVVCKRKIEAEVSRRISDALFSEVK